MNNNDKICFKIIETVESFYVRESKMFVVRFK